MNADAKGLHFGGGYFIIVFGTYDLIIHRPFKTPFFFLIPFHPLIFSLDDVSISFFSWSDVPFSTIRPYLDGTSDNHDDDDCHPLVIGSLQ